MAARVDIRTLIKEIDALHEQYPAWTKDNTFVHWFLQAFLVPNLDVLAPA